jgi:hypothetical protein
MSLRIGSNSALDQGALGGQHSSTLMIGPFLLMEVLCGFWLSLLECVLIWDRARQLGESGEYHMGRLRVVCFYVQSSEGGSPRLCH